MTHIQAEIVLKAMERGMRNLADEYMSPKEWRAMKKK
jgi:hypothetical protein